MPEGAAPSPILISRASQTWKASAHALPSKGTAHPYNVEALVSVMLQLGVTRFALRSDNEPAILELKTQAARLARDRRGFEIMPEETPEGDSASNGLAEGAVRYVKAQCRVLRFAVGALHNVTLQPRSPIPPWLVSHAAPAAAR